MEHALLPGQNVRWGVQELPGPGRTPLRTTSRPRNSSADAPTDQVTVQVNRLDFVEARPLGFDVAGLTGALSVQVVMRKVAAVNCRTGASAPPRLRAADSSQLFQKVPNRFVLARVVQPSVIQACIKCAWQESNLLPFGPEPNALSGELQAREVPCSL